MRPPCLHQQQDLPEARGPSATTPAIAASNKRQTWHDRLAHSEVSVLTYDVAAPLAGRQDEVAAGKGDAGRTAIRAAFHGTGAVQRVHLQAGGGALTTLEPGRSQAMLPDSLPESGWSQHNVAFRGSWR